MSTAITPREIEVQAAYGAGTVKIHISKIGTVSVDSTNTVVRGKVECFELQIKQRIDPSLGYFAFIGCECDISVMVFLTLDGADAIHAAMPEIAFTDERAEVQP